MPRMFTEEQVVQILQEHVAGIPLSEICGRHGLSGAKYRLNSRLEQLTVQQAATKQANTNELTSDPLDQQLGCKTFADRFRTLRLLNDLTLEAVGCAVGVSKVTVWKWENGKSQPRSDCILALAKLFSVTPGWLAFSEPR